MSKAKQLSVPWNFNLHKHAYFGLIFSFSYNIRMSAMMPSCTVFSRVTVVKTEKDHFLWITEMFRWKFFLQVSLMTLTDKNVYFFRRRIMIG